MSAPSGALLRGGSNSRYRWQLLLLYRSSNCNVTAAVMLLLLYHSSTVMLLLLYYSSTVMLLLLYHSNVTAAAQQQYRNVTVAVMLLLL